MSTDLDQHITAYRKRDIANELYSDAEILQELEAERAQTKVKVCLTKTKSIDIPNLSIEAESLIKLLPSMNFINNKATEGWKLKENSIFFEGDILGIVDFRDKGEKGKFLYNGEMLARAWENRWLASQYHAERLVEQHMTIPKSWQTFILLFAGTVWEDDDGILQIAYLAYGYSGTNKRWKLSWVKANESYSHYRLVCASRDPNLNLS